MSRLPIAHPRHSIKKKENWIQSAYDCLEDHVEHAHSDQFDTFVIEPALKETDVECVMEVHASRVSEDKPLIPNSMIVFSLDDPASQGTASSL
jgi:hypothetical protein